MATTYTPLLELPKHDPTGPFDITKINEGFDLIDTGMAKAYRGKFVINKLTNSDFRKQYFIAQAGLNGLHGTTKYVGDCWISWDADATVTDEYTTIGSAIEQRFYMTDAEANTEHTAVLYMADGTKKFHVGKPASGFGLQSTIYCNVTDAAEKKYYARIGGGQSVKHAALFPGAYTADTLPEYQPKGYAAELAECLRYCQIIPALTHIPGVTNSDTSFGAKYQIAPMRIAPSVSIASGKSISIYTGDYSATTEKYTLQYATNPSQITLSVALTAGSFVAYKPGMLTLPVDIVLSADL